MRKFTFLTIFLLITINGFSQTKELQMMFKEFDESCKLIKEHITFVSFDSYFDQANAKLSSSKLRFAKVQGEVKKADRDSIIASFNRVEEVLRNKRQYKLVPETKMKASLIVAFERKDMKGIAQNYKIIIKDEKVVTSGPSVFLIDQSEFLKKDSINKVRRDSIQIEQDRQKSLEEEKQRKTNEEALRKRKEEERQFDILNRRITGRVVDVGKFNKDGEKIKGIIIEIANTSNKAITRITGKMMTVYGADQFDFTINENIVIIPDQTIQLILSNEAWFKEYTNQKLKENVNFSKELFIGKNQKQLKVIEIKFQDGEVIKAR